MLSDLFTASALPFLSGSLGSGLFVLSSAHSQPLSAVCQHISSTISTDSQVFFSRKRHPIFPTLFPLLRPYLGHRKATAEYVADNGHTFVSSSEGSACSVEPGSTNDVGLIVRNSSVTAYFDLCPPTVANSREITHSVCRKEWWSCHKSWLFLHSRCPDVSRPFQYFHSQY